MTAAAGGDLLEPLYQLLLRAFTSSPGEGLAPPDPESTQFLTEWPASSFSDGVKNAWSPANPRGTMGGLEELSALVNPIPVVPSAVYRPSPITVEQVYGLILQAARSGGDPTAASVGVPPDRPAAAVMDEDAYRAVEREAVTRVESSNRYAMAAAGANITALARSTAAGLLDSQGAIGSPAPTGATGGAEPLDIDALRSMFDAVASVGPADGPFGALLAQAKDVFALAPIASITGTGKFRPAYLVPDDFAHHSAAARWPTVDTTVLLEGQQIHYSLRFLRVDILRPWFDGLVIAMPGWQMSGFAVGAVSKLFPLLPTSMIVSRDLRVRVDDSPAFQLTGLSRLGWFCEPQPVLPPSELSAGTA